MVVTKYRTFGQRLLVARTALKKWGCIHLPEGMPNAICEVIAENDAGVAVGTRLLADKQALNPVAPTKDSLGEEPGGLWIGFAEDFLCEAMGDGSYGPWYGHILTLQLPDKRPLITLREPDLIRVQDIITGDIFLVHKHAGSLVTEITSTWGGEMGNEKEILTTRELRVLLEEDLLAQEMKEHS